MVTVTHMDDTAVSDRIKAVTRMSKRELALKVINESPTAWFAVSPLRWGKDELVSTVLHQEGIW